MPNLDVSDVILDPMFAELLTIKRRTQVVGTNGRAQRTQTIITPKPAGVVTSEANENLKRMDFGQYRPNTIRVHTPFRLSGPAPGKEADVVTWNGDDYIVVQVDNYSHFGRGFISAACASMSPIDEAP